VSDLPAWVEAETGHAPADIGLFERALTHSSRGGDDYERLEFLGDRVLGLVIASWLYARFTDESEGQLSRRFNVLVSRETCAEVARTIGLARARRRRRERASRKPKPKRRGCCWRNWDNLYLLRMNKDSK